MKNAAFTSDRNHIKVVNERLCTMWKT